MIITKNTRNYKNHILNNVLLLAEKDIWEVIFAITNEFGIEHVPSPVGGEKVFINKLVELRTTQVEAA
jgi:hypothetical protein